MTIDVGRVIGAVTREVTSREHEGAPARVVAASRAYDTNREDLWDALTNPERIPRWFLPVSGDLRLGGSYQLKGNASGEITGCEPPRHLALTWGMHGQVSWVTVDLSEQPDGRTLLRLEHIAHVPEEFWDQFGPGAVGVGWDEALLGLDQHLATESAVGPESAQAWLASEEGRSFVRRSSDAWRAASIESGTDPAAATAAADRTTSFYLGE
ncbi:MAG: SRPBCC family protein [Gammaproteobacteria bacterium]|nr:SRPBCC family protein [Gammaproteobacteria bacterium]